MSSVPFSRLIRAKRRSRSPRFDTSPCTPVTSLPISCTAAASSGWRRPVMKTYAPSLTNCFAVARLMPLLPPVTSAILPSSLPMRVSPQARPARSADAGAPIRYLGAGAGGGIAEPFRESTARGLETRPFVAIVEAGDRHQLALVEADQRRVDHVLWRHDD